MYGPKWPFLLMYVSRDTRRIDFSQVDGLSTDPRGMGCHIMSRPNPRLGGRGGTQHKTETPLLELLTLVSPSQKITECIRISLKLNL